MSTEITIDPLLSPSAIDRTCAPVGAIIARQGDQ